MVIIMQISEMLIYLKIPIFLLLSYDTKWIVPEKIIDVNTE